MAASKQFRQRLCERAAELREWLKTHGGECDVEQRHTRHGTSERIYWHYGYLLAVEDMLRLLDDLAESTNSGTRKPDTEP